ncbi:MAG: hypothetical protein J6U54_12435 [Clostridiales bacterium]|nr:hypothetical protein [Clostridiales bacterium]
MNNTEINNKKVSKYKLNMLEPGVIMIKIIGILAAVSLLFWAFEWNMLSLIVLAVAGGVFLLLMVLLIIEAYQDNCLDQLFIVREEEDIEEDYGF